MATLWQHYGNKKKLYTTRLYILLVAIVAINIIKDYKKAIAAVEQGIQPPKKHQKEIYRELWQQWQQWQQIRISSHGPRGHTRARGQERGGTNGTISTTDTRGSSAMPGRIAGILADY